LLAFALWGATIGGADLDDSRSDQSVGGAD
jgi:hypothetical protein